MIEADSSGHVGEGNRGEMELGRYGVKDGSGFCEKGRNGCGEHIFQEERGKFSDV